MVSQITQQRQKIDELQFVTWYAKDHSIYKKKDM